MNSDDFEKIETPKVKVFKPNDGYTSDDIFCISYVDIAMSIFVKGFGSSDIPYKLTVSIYTIPELGRLFFSLANSDPENPRDIYVDINDIVIRFCPTERIPVQIFKLNSEEDVETANNYQSRILEEILPGLSSILEH